MRQNIFLRCAALMACALLQLSNVTAGTVDGRILVKFDEGLFPRRHPLRVPRTPGAQESKPNQSLNCRDNTRSHSSNQKAPNQNGPGLLLSLTYLLRHAPAAMCPAFKRALAAKLPTYQVGYAGRLNSSLSVISTSSPTTTPPASSVLFPRRRPLRVPRTPPLDILPKTLNFHSLADVTQW